MVAAALILGWFFGTRISELLSFRLCSLILFDSDGQTLSFDDPLLVSRAVELELKIGKTTQPTCLPLTHVCNLPKQVRA